MLARGRSNPPHPTCTVQTRPSTVTPISLTCSVCVYFHIVTLPWPTDAMSIFRVQNSTSLSLNLSLLGFHMEASYYLGFLMMYTETLLTFTNTTTQTQTLSPQAPITPDIPPHLPFQPASTTCLGSEGLPGSYSPVKAGYCCG